MTWDEQATRILTEDWHNGALARHISGKLKAAGYSYSTCAVIRRAQRVGLPGRQNARQVAVLAAPAQRYVFGKGPASTHREPPRPAQPVVHPPVMRNLTVLELQANHCRWPISGDDEPHRFCANGRDGKRPYCATHHAASIERK